MRKCILGLALVGVAVCSAQPVWAINPRCCGYDGSCTLSTETQCGVSTEQCPANSVCDSVSPPSGCGRLKHLCRVQSTGQCLMAYDNCADAIDCVTDPTCLPEWMANDEQVALDETEVEVTWCEADDTGVEDEDTPCEE